MMDIKEVLLQWFINSLIKKTSGSDIKDENISNKELAEELHKSAIRKFNKRKVHSPFIDNAWVLILLNLEANLVKEFVFYCVLLIFIANMHELFL